MRQLHPPLHSEANISTCLTSTQPLRQHADRYPAFAPKLARSINANIRWAAETHLRCLWVCSYIRIGPSLRVERIVLFGRTSYTLSLDYRYVHICTGVPASVRLAADRTLTWPTAATTLRRPMSRLL